MIRLGPRAIKSVFFGYAKNSKAYRSFDLSSNVIVESRDHVEFFENNFNHDSKYDLEPKEILVSNFNIHNTSLLIVIRGHLHICQ